MAVVTAVKTKTFLWTSFACPQKGPEGFGDSHMPPVIPVLVGAGVVLGGVLLAASAGVAAPAQPRLEPLSTLPLAQLKHKPPSNVAQAPDDASPPPSDAPAPGLLPQGAPLDLPPDLIDDSPVLQRWLEDIPDVQQDIRTDPAFRTRFRVGYSEVDGEEGLFVGVEDVFVADTGLTLSAEYQGSFEADRKLYGPDLRYYVLPLGSVVNVAPVVGYRRFEHGNHDAEGLHTGLRAVVALSRTGAADLALTQSWVAPGTDEEVGLTTLSVGYAVSDRLRLTTDIQAQNSSVSKDTRFGIGLEWLL